MKGKIYGHSCSKMSCRLYDRVRDEGAVANVACSLPLCCLSHERLREFSSHNPTETNNETMPGIK